MKMKLVGLDTELEKMLLEVNKVFNINFDEDGEEINVLLLTESSENDIEICRGRENTIKYKNKNNFFRALGLYAQFVEEGKEEFYHAEKPLIKSVATMVDVSRNAVYKVEELKKFLIKLAFIGHNQCMLYTEDTYEVNGYEYFGYLRGKYSKKELRELDDFAYTLGIELIPCIQTLGHLKQTLKWDYANEIKDTESVLLVGEEKTYTFIEAMISTLREVFRSENLHIGMDEALDLGRGEYLTQNGYKSHHELMIEHLNRVCDIAKKYDFTPMMWDDMFFRTGAPNGQYYDVNTVITDEIIESIPKEVKLVYWDYYNSKEETYSKLLDIRKRFNNKIVFAGGVWKWLGYAPTYSRTFATTEAALAQCKLNGIDEVIATAWGDEGAEAPLDSILLGLILFGEHAYYLNVDQQWLNRRCEFLTGLSVEDFMALEELDLVANIKVPNLKSLNPSKYLIYQDILLGAFDKHIENAELQYYYRNLAKKYDVISNKTEEYKSMFKMFAAISDFLSVKGDLGIRIRKAYLNNDKEEIKNIVDNVLPDLKDKLDNFHSAFRTLWYEKCKGHGFEVIDIRLGGIKARIDSTIFRLNQYLSGQIYKIEELDEERLYFSNEMDEETKQISFVKYQHIATQNILTW